MISFKFENSYANLPSQFYVKQGPAKFPGAKLIAFNSDLFDELGGIKGKGTSDQDLAQAFSGQTLIQGSEPIAQVYAGHQFGHFNPQLGDGRALLLGEVITPNNLRFDLQLKGCGQTPFSRRGDGRSAIGPVLREYIVSEAMYNLGVKTTRSLAAVWSGEDVYRQEIEPGGIFTRVASSHLRVGSFEYFLGQKDYDSLTTLIHYAIERHYPEAFSSENPYLHFFELVSHSLNDLVTDWMALGFIHGVMNTDNTSISGETIDYGPCAFMDKFESEKSYSYVDRMGRYRYDNQANILQWNLARLAECLIHLVDDNQEVAVDELTKKLEQSRQNVAKMWYQKSARKLGIVTPNSKDSEIVRDWFKYLEQNQLDFTLAHKYLKNELEGENGDFFVKDSKFEKLISQLRDRIENIEESVLVMDKLNPWFIPRNHQVEKAIQEALSGQELKTFEQLGTVLKRPFDYQEEFSHLLSPPSPSEEVKQTFCGT